MITVYNNSDFRVKVILKFNNRADLRPGQQKSFTLLERDRPNALFLSKHGIAVTQMFLPGTVHVLKERVVRCTRENTPDESEDYLFKDSAKRSEIRKSYPLSEYVLTQIKSLDGHFSLIDDVPWWPQRQEQDYYID
ncbi:hypothetical protein J3B02_003501 [Coemansia erecta]|uniref:Uncharacterized protein n=1 Tax=Coemansia asiatica TaxID=1052880 RepID=A0A9W8CJV8_9FUNG|nr:hypothetical protein LPJ64_003592 [Coemansia asiatica]KAJ2852095.1 hypothetical protein J3B02_003501 [Coemansia erecta]KAJ2888579.1 hypothetical protein FB639_000538 [Coemansia asiatica]